MSSASPDHRYTIVSKGKRYHLSREEVAQELRNGHVHEGTLTWRTDGGGVTTVRALLSAEHPADAPRSSASSQDVDFPSNLGVSLASLATFASVLTGASYLSPVAGLLLAVVAFGEGTFAGATAILLGSVALALMLYGAAQGLGMICALAERAGVSIEPLSPASEVAPALSHS